MDSTWGSAIAQNCSARHPPVLVALPCDRKPRKQSQCNTRAHAPRPSRPPRMTKAPSPPTRPAVFSNHSAGHSIFLRHQSTRCAVGPRRRKRSDALCLPRVRFLRRSEPAVGVYQATDRRRGLVATRGRRRVVITGLGAVTPLGNDVQSSSELRWSGAHCSWPCAPQSSD